MARRRRRKRGGWRFRLRGNEPFVFFFGIACGVIGFWLAVQIVNSPLVASILLERKPARTPAGVSHKEISARLTRVLPQDLNPEYKKPGPVSLPPIPRPVITKKEVPPVALPVKKGPRIAFVIDDIGYHNRYEKQLFSTGAPLTLSILPQLAYSTHFSREGKVRGYEIILHQPLEPEVPLGDPDPGMITTRMNKDTVKRILAENLASVPDADGINNHMGSRATQNAKLMKWILDELKKRKLFFLDSLTTERSVGWITARNMKLPHLKRNVFLDNENNERSIENQIWLLVNDAKTHGVAVGIGHYRQKTLETIKRLASQIKKHGVEIVSLKEILKQ